MKAAAGRQTEKQDVWAAGAAPPPGHIPTLRPGSSSPEGRSLPWPIPALAHSRPGLVHLSHSSQGPEDSAQPRASSALLPPSFLPISIEELREFLKPPTKQKEDILWTLEVCSILQSPNSGTSCLRISKEL